MDGVEENTDNDQGVACLRALSTLKKQFSSPLDSNGDAQAPNEGKSTPVVTLQIMVISQHINSILFAMQDALPKYAGIDICCYTEGDIASFVKTKGDELLRRKPKLEEGRDKIVQSLTNGANGMFQWVNGAIQLLEKYAGDVKDIDMWLVNLPPTLTETWEKVFMRLPQGTEAADAQKRIRLALKLLAVYARPLSATELYYAYIIGTADGTTKTIDSEVKRLLRGQEQLKNSQFAMEEIRSLLDSLVEFDVRKGTVELVHDSIRKALLLPDDPKDRQPQSSATEKLRLAGYQFTGREAHTAAAELCMRIVQSSTLSHATSFATSAIPFVEYSWDQWKYHLNRSSAEPGIILDQMIRGVSRDTIAFLGALTEFVGRDIPPVGGRYSDLEYILSLKRARECLLPAIESLTTIQKTPDHGFSKSLISYQKLFAAAEEITVAQTKREKCEVFARRNYQKVRSRFMPKETTVLRLRIDTLLKKPSYKKVAQMSREVSALLESARNLRTVALRFAINPVYSALISSAGGTTFSPIHPLVYAASLLEECGSAPFWDQLSSNWDPVDPFICNDDDPHAGPARFVLQCFAWRELQDQMPPNPKSNRQYMRAASRVNAQPNPGGRQLLRVSTANRDQVKRLHGMSGSQYMTSYTVLSFFGGEDKSLMKTFVYNPIGQHHLRSNLLLNEHGSYLENMFEDPKLTLARHAPNSIMEAPVKEALEAIPNFLRLCFVKYVTLLFEVFGNVTSRAITAHAQQMMEVAQGLQMTLLHVNFLWETFSWASVCHIIPAIILFSLRIVYFPSLGGHHLNDPWARLELAVKEPALYLQSQHEFSWWYWTRAVSTSFAFNFLIGALSALHAEGTLYLRELRESFLTYSAYAYILEYVLITVANFMYLCSLHRYLISVLYLLGTIVAGGYVMMNDQSNMYSILTFTVWYWFYAFLGILNNLVVTGSMQVFGLWGLLVVALSFVPQYYLVKTLVRYQLAVAWLLSWPFQPLVWAWKLAWASFLYAWVNQLQVIGIGILCVSVGVAFGWFRQQVTDPYDIEGSVRQLRKSAALAKLTLKEAELRHIGEYPLGGEIGDDLRKKPASENGRAPSQPDFSPGPEPSTEKMNGHAMTQNPPPFDAAAWLAGAIRNFPPEKPREITPIRPIFTPSIPQAPNFLIPPPPKPYVPPPPKAEIPPPPKAKIAPPAKVEPEPSPHPTKGTSSGLDTTPASSLDVDDLRDLLNRPDHDPNDSMDSFNNAKVRRRINRQFEVGWQ